LQKFRQIVAASFLVRAGFKPARKGGAPATPALRRKLDNSCYKNSPPVEGCPLGRGGRVNKWDKSPVPLLQASKRQKLHLRRPPRRFAPPLHRRGIILRSFLSVNCRLHRMLKRALSESSDQRTAVRSCENVRAKQLGEYAIPKKDAPCFEIIFQHKNWIKASSDPGRRLIIFA